MKKVIVLGAGISGLVQAWDLKKKYQDRIDLKIIEASDRVGGWIRTEKVDDFLFEKGPRGFTPQGKGEKTLALVRELGIEGELIPSCATRRYLLLNRKLVPVGLGLLLRCHVFGAMTRDFFALPCRLEDETIDSFCRRHCGKAWAETLIDPLVRGIFCGNSRELSIRSCFPSLWNLDQQKKSVMAAMLIRKKSKYPPLYSFKKGMETLPQTLGEKLKEHLLLSKQIKSLSIVEDKVRLELENEILTPDFVISTIPLYELCKIWKESPKELQGVTYNSLATVSCGWHKEKLTPNGYGFLIPSKEKEKIYGMTWDSAIFPQQSAGTRVCVMLPPDSEEELKKTALHYIRETLGITEPPDALSVSIAKQAIPQYTLGHEERMMHVLNGLPSFLKVKGTFFGGVGINDCVNQVFALS